MHPCDASVYVPIVLRRRNARSSLSLRVFYTGYRYRAKDNTLNVRQGVFCEEY